MTSEEAPRRDGWRREPSRARLPLDRTDRAEILAAHEAAIDAGAPTYVDPATGYQVMTADALAERGTCCGSGCRHCPWEPHGD
mgnify:CR=1 FL=1